MTGLATQFIKANAVGYGEIQKVSAVSLLGNASASLANVEEITIGSSLNFSAAILNTIQSITTASTPTFASIILSTASTINYVWTCTNTSTGAGSWQTTAATALTLTGDVTGTGTGSIGTTIANNAVTYAKFQQVAASSLIGNPSGSLANAQGITLGAGLSFSGTTLVSSPSSPLFNIAANDSNVVFTISSNTYQSCLPTAARTYTLPTTSVTQGYSIIFVNQSLFLITVQSSGSNIIGYVYPSSQSQFIALTATPTTASNWEVNYQTAIPATITAFDAAETFTILTSPNLVVTPTAARTYTLATTGICAGYTIEITNTANFLITVNSSGANLVGYVLPNSTTKFKALVNTPTTAANWQAILVGNGANELDTATATTINAMASTQNVSVFTGSTATALNGITAGYLGQIITIVNNSTGIITITHNSSSASSRNKIITPTGNNLIIPGASAISTSIDLIYLAYSGTNSWFIKNSNNAEFIVGNSSGIAPLAGLIGEQLIATVASVTGTTSGNFGDLTSLSLSAGVWDVSALALIEADTTISSSVVLGISATSGNSGTGLTIGLNRLDFLPPSSSSNNSGSIPNYRVVISSTTPYYLKYVMNWVTTAPTLYGTLRAVRVG